MINNKPHICKECQMKYKSKALAEKCEDFCKKHKACNTMITKYAIENK